jgi:hypothetical protein
MEQMGVAGRSFIAVRETPTRSHFCEVIQAFIVGGNHPGKATDAT